jgi:predicted acylesterase/phospholipase RssA
MKKIIWVFGLLLASLGCFGQAASGDTTSRRLLVVSGGGARGAWGAGVVSSLIKQNGGYNAVFGTSTGSLMAPLILLGDMDVLDSAYTHVTQDSIFSNNPFNVSYDAATGTVTTSLKTFKAILRFIFGKKTFGETNNLFHLIQHFLTRSRYDSLLQLYRNKQAVLAVAVTDTRTGLLRVIYDSAFTPTDTGYNNLCRWIWASANEPLYMSYVPMGNASYVDGGVREVVPIQEGLIYAISHDIDAIDVVINNSKVPINQNWKVDSAGILSGLERLLNIYNLGTVRYNESYAMLLARYFDEVGSLPHPPDAGPMIRHLDSVGRLNPDTVLRISELRRYLPASAAGVAAPAKRLLHMNFYCMTDDVAAKYQNELGFIQPAMLALLLAGKAYGADPGQGCFSVDIDKDVMRQHVDVLSNK